VDSKENELYKDNPKIKKNLRTLGKTIAIIGGLMIISGLLTLIFNPGSFWLIFVGAPLFAFGRLILRYGYMGEADR